MGETAEQKKKREAAEAEAAKAAAEAEAAAAEENNDDDDLEDEDVEAADEEGTFKEPDSYPQPDESRQEAIAELKAWADEAASRGVTFEEAKQVLVDSDLQATE